MKFPLLPTLVLLLSLAIQTANAATTAPTVSALTFAPAAKYTVAPVNNPPVEVTPASGGSAKISVNVGAGNATTTVKITVTESTTGFTFTNTQTIDPLTIPPTTVTVNGLVHGKVYHVKVEATNSASAPGKATTVESDFIQDNAPLAQDDEGTVPNFDYITIRVLKNDSDADYYEVTEGEKVTKVPLDTLTIKSITQPAHGTARISGKTVQYAPNSTFQGTDELTYTVWDGFRKATAKIVLTGVRFAIAGSSAAVIKDANGVPAGYLRLDTIKTGPFTGHLELAGKSYHLKGSFDVTGHFSGYATDENGVSVGVYLEMTPTDSGLSLTASIQNGQFTASQATKTESVTTLADLEGRYTVELPPSTGSTDPGTTDGTTTAAAEGSSAPEGSGWMTIKVNEFGSVRIKGKAGDGRAFSAQALVTFSGEGSAPEITFYATPKSSFLSGTLDLGETITGQVQWAREETNADFYPGGFDLTISAKGGLFVKPEKGRRSLADDSTDAGRITLEITGGGVTDFSHEARLSESDGVQVLDEGLDEVNLKIDRKSGVFKGKFRSGDQQERRIKISGVMLQNENRGAGVFLGSNKTGRVEITIAAETTPTPGGGTGGGNTGGGDTGGDNGGTGGDNGGGIDGLPDDGE